MLNNVSQLNATDVQKASPEFRELFIAFIQQSYFWNSSVKVQKYYKY